MKQTLTVSDIAEQLRRDENANWSPAGARAMAEYLEEFESETGAEMEFDRVAIRCDFAEYKSLRDWADDYCGGSDKAKTSIDWDDDADEESIETEIRDYINERGTLIEFNGGIIVSSF
jgi:hypothetical protein